VADAGSRRTRSLWAFRAHEVLTHAVLTATVLWVVAIGTLTLGTSYRDPFGQLKWTDFVHFYTFGHVARHGPLSDLYDAEALHARQVQLVPASAPEAYLAVYPPQVALVFAPLSDLPYHVAAAIWALVNLSIYAWAIWLAWHPLRAVVPRAALVAAAAAAFPPFWSLVLHGQTTAIVVLAFALGARALSAGRTVLAGAAFGLLLMKPQFGLVLAVVILSCREWRMLAGVALSAGVQVLLVGGLMGPAVLQDYLRMLTQISTAQNALEPSVGLMQSWAAVTRLLPGPLSTVAWLLASAWTCWLVVRVWRTVDALAPRIGALAIGSLLVNPHVNLYDATALAAPLLSTTLWVETGAARSAALRDRWHLALYALYVTLLLPTARFVQLQFAPFVMLWLLLMTRRMSGAPGGAASAPPRASS
jgi:hypothetical protein